MREECVLYGKYVDGCKTCKEVCRSVILSGPGASLFGFCVFVFNWHCSKSICEMTYNIVN